MSEPVSYRVRKAFDKAAVSYAEAAVLQREVTGRLLERLDYIKLQPGYVLDLGAGVGIGTCRLKERYPKAEVVAADFALQMLLQLKKSNKIWRRPLSVCADAFALPFADNSFDLIFSSLTLQWCEPLLDVFRECSRILKPGGAILFASLGPDTLKELRASWQAVDSGVHVNEFVDMHHVGDSLLAAGFADPVMDVEFITMTYPSVLKLLKEIKQLGASTVVKKTSGNFARKADLQAMQKAYEVFCTAESLFPVTYEIVYGMGWGCDTDLSRLSYVPLEQLKS